MSTTHQIQQGECVETIAKQYGFRQWKTIWNHPKNKSLKDKRKNPNVLLPGDELFIPDLNIGKYARATGSQHTFKLKPPAPVKLRLQLVDGRGEAYADGDYTLEVHDGNGAVVVKKNGKTPSNGLVETEIPEDASGGRVTLIPKGGKPEDIVEWDLHLGHLDPSQEVSGAQARLGNLGIPVGEQSDSLTEQMKAVLKSFQELHGLTESGELDAATMAKLADLHDKVT